MIWAWISVLGKITPLLLGTAIGITTADTARPKPPSAAKIQIMQRHANGIAKFTLTVDGQKAVFERNTTAFCPRPANKSWIGHARIEDAKKVTTWRQIVAPYTKSPVQNNWVALTDESLHYVINGVNASGDHDARNAIDAVFNLACSEPHWRVESKP